MEVTTGAWGWQHKAWENDVFYPADLPEDWQLTYYSNEFQAVVVPASYWGAEGFGAADWSDDVPDNFMFYIDWPFASLQDLQDYQLCADECRTLGENLGAILVDLRQWQDLSPQHKTWFEDLTAEVTVLAYNEVTPSPGYAVAADDRFDSIESSLLLLHSGDNENLRELGQRLKQLCQQTHCQAVILADAKPSLSRLKEIKTLLALLGF